MYCDQRYKKEWKLFKGGNCSREEIGGFDCDNYSREETIRGNTVFNIY